MRNLHDQVLGLCSCSNFPKNNEPGLLTKVSAYALVIQIFEIDNAPRNSPGL